jgi:hypothetical protein
MKSKDSENHNGKAPSGSSMKKLAMIKHNQWHQNLAFDELLNSQ